MSDAKKKMQIRKAYLRGQHTGDTREYDRLIAEKYEDAKSTAGVMTVLSQVLNNSNGMSAQEKQNITAQLLGGLPAGQRQMIEQMIRTQPAPSEKKKKRKKKKKKKKKTLKEDEDEEEPDVLESKQVDVSLGGVASLSDLMEEDEEEPDVSKDEVNVTLEGVTGFDEEE